VGTHEGPRHALGRDLRHMTGYTLAAGAACFVVRVFFQTRYVRPIGRVCRMAVQADLVSRLAELSGVLRSVNIVT
jgi:hypothetical protein